MGLISHKFSDLINLDVRKGGAETPNAAIIGISAARRQPRLHQCLPCRKLKRSYLKHALHLFASLSN
ncbi:hypothetical protein B9P84_16870 [Citrobacter braakii]|uniref:Uncharacterized protein n=1 Tax=Citrobacter braakii TaxID=57706 RepID=A0A1R0FU61_CITBR|nr:hypothetical protein CEP69_04820 [Citrobacter braakii]AUV26961.1 hypothetical protein C2U38_15815 [Citrobacter freundii complex sp. CFNIH3]PAX80172.1 hypothetical protein CIK43_08880 [Citrobacter sp. TSA-1]PLC65115.1 hypothetical protein B9P82_04850 [Citrobacter sp. L55]POV71140.1 hypothetical protein C3411_10355 [Citrobacter freundii complex sp. CFNIH5]